MVAQGGSTVFVNTRTPYVTLFSDVLSSVEEKPAELDAVSEEEILLPISCLWSFRCSSIVNLRIANKLFSYQYPPYKLDRFCRRYNYNT